MTQRFDFSILSNLGNVANPANPQDAATKAYVDGATGGGTITSPNNTIAVGGTAAARTLDVAQQSATTNQALTWNGTKFAPNDPTLRFSTFSNITGNLVTLGQTSAGLSTLSVSGDVRSTFPTGLVFYLAAGGQGYTVTGTTFASTITNVGFNPAVASTIPAGTNILVATRNTFTDIAAGSNASISVANNTATIGVPNNNISDLADVQIARQTLGSSVVTTDNLATVTAQLNFPATSGGTTFTPATTTFNIPINTSSGSGETTITNYSPIDKTKLRAYQSGDIQGNQWAIQFSSSGALITGDSTTVSVSGNSLVFNSKTLGDQSATVSQQAIRMEYKIGGPAWNAVNNAPGLAVQFVLDGQDPQADASQYPAFIAPFSYLDDFYIDGTTRQGIYVSYFNYCNLASGPTISSATAPATFNDATFGNVFYTILTLSSVTGFVVNGKMSIRNSGNTGWNSAWYVEQIGPGTFNGTTLTSTQVVMYFVSEDPNGNYASVVGGDIPGKLLASPGNYAAPSTGSTIVIPWTALTITNTVQPSTGDIIQNVANPGITTTLGAFAWIQRLYPRFYATASAAGRGNAPFTTPNNTKSWRYTIEVVDVLGINSHSSTTVGTDCFIDFQATNYNAAQVLVPSGSASIQNYQAVLQQGNIATTDAVHVDNVTTPTTTTRLTAGGVTYNGTQALVKSFATTGTWPPTYTAGALTIPTPQVENLSNIVRKRWVQVDVITGYTYTTGNTYPNTITLNSVAGIAVNSVITLIPQIADDSSLITGLNCLVTAVNSNTLTITANPTGNPNPTYWNPIGLPGRIVYVDVTSTNPNYGDVLINQQPSSSTPSWRYLPGDYLARPQGVATTWSANSNINDIQQRIKARGLIVNSNGIVESPVGTVTVGARSTELLEQDGATAVAKRWFLPSINGTAGQLLGISQLSGNDLTLSWQTASGGGGGGVIIPVINFTSSATPSSGQTFTNTNLSSYTNANQLSVTVNGATLNSSNYSLSGTTLTITSYLLASSAIQVQPMGSSNVASIAITSPNGTITVGGTGSAPTLDLASQSATNGQVLTWNGTKYAPATPFAGQGGNIFIARRTTATAITGGTAVSMAIASAAITQDVSTIPNLTTFSGSIFQNTASYVRAFLITTIATFQGAASNIGEADVWIQVGAAISDVSTASSIRLGFSSVKNPNTTGAVVSLSETIYVPANNYFGLWLYCDQGCNLNGPSTATAVFGIRGDYQNRITIREI